MNHNVLGSKSEGLGGGYGVRKMLGSKSEGLGGGYGVCKMLGGEREGIPRIRRHPRS